MNNTNIPFYDINNNLIEIGDIIYRVIFSNIVKCQVVNITNSVIKVSVHRRESNRTWPKIGRTTYNNKGLDEHNSTVDMHRYIYSNVSYPNVLLIEKRKLTKEDVDKYKKHKKQLNN